MYVGLGVVGLYPRVIISFQNILLRRTSSLYRHLLTSLIRDKNLTIVGTFLNMPGRGAGRGASVDLAISTLAVRVLWWNNISRMQAYKGRHC